MDNSFIFTKIGKMQVEKLSYSYCCEHKDELLKLINIIPYIHWSERELLSQENDFYQNKWNYSYVVKTNENKIIGVLITYFRIADNNHIFDSLYIHRFAIDPQYQDNGIGTETLKYFIQKSFDEIPWLLNISVQTNDNLDNNHVIKFYKDIGFNEMYNILYSNKIDVLLLLERNVYVNYAKKYKSNSINLKHPRLSIVIDGVKSYNTLPVIYFSSTNERKKEMVKFIFHNYNIEVVFVKSPIELTEPQLEKSEIEEERKLVSLPLKSVSRFINSVPYVIEDTMLFVEFFNRNGKQWELPGLDTKRWLRQMGLDGFLEIMGNTNKRRARFVSQTGAYLKANKYYYGRGEIEGNIAYEMPKTILFKNGTYPYFFHLLFIPNGADKSLAEMDMHEYSKYDYMRKSIVQLISDISNNECLYRQYTLFDYFKEEE